MAMTAQQQHDQAARESASVARGTPGEYGAIRNHKVRRESKDSKCATECLRLGRAQQVACTVLMEHHLRQSWREKGEREKESVLLNLRAKHIEKGRSLKLMERSTNALVWQRSDNGQTVPPSNRESHSLKMRTAWILDVLSCSSTEWSTHDGVINIILCVFVGFCKLHCLTPEIHSVSDVAVVVLSML
jgi:hypothetical protein